MLRVASAPSARRARDARVDRVEAQISLASTSADAPDPRSRLSTPPVAGRPFRGTTEPASRASQIFVAPPALANGTMSAAVEAYLNGQAAASPELASHYEEMRDLYERRLWH